MLRVAPTAFCPRSYKLEDSQQLAEFVEDFRTTAAFNILEVFGQRGGAQLFPGEELQQTLHLVELCIQVVSCALRAVARGEHENVDYEAPAHIDDDDWAQILELSYKTAVVLVTNPVDGLTTWSARDITVPQSERTEVLVKEARRLTAVAQALWPQRTIDGHRNIWVVKAPDAARYVRAWNAVLRVSLLLLTKRLVALRAAARGFSCTTGWTRSSNASRGCVDESCRNTSNAPCSSRSRQRPSWELVASSSIYACGCFWSEANP